MSLRIGEKTNAITKARWQKHEAARNAAATGTLSADAMQAAIEAADAEAATAQAVAVEEGEKAAVARTDEEVNEIFEREHMWEFEKQLFIDERAGILAAVAALPKLRHLKWSLEVRARQLECIVLGSC